MEWCNEDMRAYRSKHILRNPENKLYFSKTNACKKNGKNILNKMSEKVTKKGAIVYFWSVFSKMERRPPVRVYWVVFTYFAEKQGKIRSTIIGT